jgi:hypothetical protein
MLAETLAVVPDLYYQAKSRHLFLVTVGGRWSQWPVRVGEHTKEQ